jgi:hypothetical protein
MSGFATFAAFAISKILAWLNPFSANTFNAAVRMTALASLSVRAGRPGLRLVTAMVIWFEL